MLAERRGRLERGLRLLEMRRMMASVKDQGFDRRARPRLDGADLGERAVLVA
jgi:hypothetical protein